MFRHICFLAVLCGAALLSVSFAPSALAQSSLDVGLTEVGQSSGLPQEDIRLVIGNIISILLGFLGIAAVGVVIYGGVLYMTAGGRDDQVQTAQRLLINGAIGLVIILSAYAITRFVISTILDATGTTPGGLIPGGGGGGGNLTFGSGFTLVSVVPKGSVPIRNVLVQINFTSSVDESTAANNIVVQAVGSEKPVEGVLSVRGSRVTFRPTEPCPAPHEEIGCFEANTTYDVTIASGLRGANGTFVSCGLGGCSGAFTTGDLIDTEPPSVQIAYPTPSMSIGMNPDLGVTANAQDDAGVGTVELFADGDSIGTDAPNATMTAFAATAEWSATGLALLSSHTIGAGVMDLAGNTATASDVRVIVRADHCFDGAQNEGETGIDCGGDAASTGYCGACGGSECTEVVTCSGGLSCEAGVCEALPRITRVTPDNGAPGNLITLEGTQFGAEPGRVYFLGDPTTNADDVEAALSCGEAWYGSQVIVTVPSVGPGFPAGPLALETASGQVDRTDDEVGVVMDFDVNTTRRPGLCSISPREGLRGSAVTIIGANLGSAADGRLSFGSSSVSASGITSWTNGRIEALVPPTDIGVKTVSVTTGSQASNPLRYAVQPPTYTSGPAISYLSPSSAPADAYLTLVGTNFGTSQGTVLFTDPVSGWTQIGSTNFPDACVADTWTSDAVTIKVPKTFRDSVPTNQTMNPGSYELTLIRADGAVSEPVSFTLESGIPGPGVCGFSPISGPTGTTVHIYGEHFGSTADVVAFSGAASAAGTSLWKPGEIAATVPMDAITGPVSVQVGSQTSNEVPFEVGACTPGAADSCEAGFRCCANTLACTPEGVACAVTPPATNFLFEFATGPIPVYPRVLEQCGGEVMSPSPWSRRSGGGDVCVNALVRVDFSVEMDAASVTSDSVRIEPCTGSGENVCDELGDPLSAAFAVSSGLSVAGTIVASPGTLEAGTTYQVTLDSTLRAAGENGETLPQPYIFQFTTREDARPCDVEEVVVTPGRATLTELGNGTVGDTDAGDIRLMAAGRGDDACVLLGLTDAVNWSTSNNSGPAIRLNPVATNGGLIDVQALRETVNNAASVIATLVQQGLFGQSLITVNFTDPTVQNAWPACDAACTNAEIGMQFSTPIDPATLLRDNSVRVDRCEDELCLIAGLSPVGVKTIEPVADTAGIGRSWTISLSEPLEPGQFYRVRLSADIQSTSGVALTALNFGSTYSWTFRVRTDSAQCAIDHVETTPATHTLRAIGDQQAYSVTAYGAPDVCSASGQRLDASTYGWDWQIANRGIATFVTGPSGALLDLGTPTGCSDSCLLLGSQSAVHVCGDRTRDYGEECDDGNTANGDGCSSRCLWEGTQACTLTCVGSGASCTQDADCGAEDRCVSSGTNCCGKCDDRNLVAGDGCSAICRNEGARAVGATCGNGAIAYDTAVGGESCDDGNRANGDGCSSECLWEGSSASVGAQCGNARLEVGEECDDSNAANGDGCSARCLFEGGRRCSDTVTSPCCGDGVLQVPNFEQCDGGEGCSDRCLLLGSSFSYATPSFCGDGLVGAGESRTCETTAVGNGRVDPLQIVTAAADVARQSTPPTNGVYTTSVQAQTTGAVRVGDTAQVSVQCSCNTSLDCSGLPGGAYACGAASGCCVPRPALPTALPVGENVCRNADVRIVFGERMNANSFVEEDGTVNVALRLLGSNEADCGTHAGYEYVSAEAFHIAFLPAAVNRAFMQAWRAIRPEAHALSAGCYVPAEAQVMTIGDHTEVRLSYGVALEPKAEYQVVVVGDGSPLDGAETGVRTLLGAGYSTPEVLLPSFTTGEDVCALETLQVTDVTGQGYFSSANASHAFEAAALTNRQGRIEAIAPISGVYAWTIDWLLPPTSNVLTLDDAQGTDEQITSGTSSGTVNVTATATITTDALNAPQYPGEDPLQPDGTEGRHVTGALRATVFICEVPWPSLTTFPLSDTSDNNDGLTQLGLWTGFATQYCRAQEADAETILPDFQVTQVTQPSVGVEKEFIFRHPTRAEAIGIRVFDNQGDASHGSSTERYDSPQDVPGFLPARLWYAQQGFSGALSDVSVDGYNGVVDGRTVYVQAPVLNTATHLLEPKIFAISYSDGASPETRDIYNQIVHHFRFLAAATGPGVVTNAGICVDAAHQPLTDTDGAYVACSDNLACIQATGVLTADCDAAQDQIRRDLARVEDLRTVEDAIMEYGLLRKHCSATTGLVCVSDVNCPAGESCQADVPLLDAGTFLRGWSTSAWPSWTSQLSNTLGTALPVDPLNAHAPCEGGDAASCWNGNTNVYQCLPGSHVYRYTRAGIEQYTLSVDTELRRQFGAPAWSTYPYPLSDDARMTLGGFSYAASGSSSSVLTTPLTCQSAVGLSAACGDGALGASEICEIGQTSQQACDTDGDDVPDGVRTTVCADGVNSASVAACRGFVNVGSACVPFSCGNGVTEGVCVGGPVSGVACLTNAACGTGSCSFAVSDGAEACDDGELNGLYGHCSAQCTYSTSALICGNGQVEGPEVCDCGTDASGLPVGCSGVNGSYNMSGASCSWDCSGAGPRCGDGVKNGGEQCDTEAQTWSGSLCVNLSNPGTSSWSACTTDASCATGEVCGDASVPLSQSCTPASFCAGGTNNGAVCTIDANCTGGGRCTSFATYRSRTCSSTSCTWGTNGGWSACAQQGSCGNGVTEGGEQCDDGNTNNADGCTNVCRFNTCGDGFLNPATESCDLGSSNGQVCTPGYGSSCNYCTTTCRYQSVSGAFCGDRQTNLSAGEICDGNPPLTYVNMLTGDTEGACLTLGQAHPTLPFVSCQLLGACNGGSNNGEACLTNTGCGGGGVCTYPVCGASCQTACPLDYQTRFVLAQPWAYTSGSVPAAPLSGATFQDHLRLYSYQTNGVCAGTENSGSPVACQVDANCSAYGGGCLYQNTPNLARVQFPACRVGEQLLANVTYQMTYPELDVVFVIDASASMNECIVGRVNPSDPTSACLAPGTRWDVMRTALQNAVNTLHEQYPETVRIGLVTFGGGGLSRVPFNAASGPTVVEGYDMLQSTTDCVNEPYWNPVSGSTDWPDNWEDIEGLGPPIATRQDSAGCLLLAPEADRTDVASFLATSLIAPANGQTSGSSTPTAAGLYRAAQVMNELPVTNKRVVILLSDGAPSCSGATDVYGDARCKPAADAIWQETSALKTQGIDVYTAFFGADPSEHLGTDSLVRNAQMFNVFSSDCPANVALLNNSPSALQLESNDVAGVSYYSRFTSCTDTPAFAYFGDDASAFDTMFDRIIDNIVNARLYFGNNPASQSSVLLRQGPGVPIPLPDGFACPVPGDGTVEIKLTFPGQGTVSLENLQFQYCAP